MTATEMTIAALAMRIILDARSPSQRYRDGWERTFGPGSDSDSSTHTATAHSGSEPGAFSGDGE